MIKWVYISQRCAEVYPAIPGVYLVTVVDDDGKRMVCTAEYDLFKGERFWEIDCRLTTVHSGKVGSGCSHVVAWSELPECA